MKKLLFYFVILLLVYACQKENVVIPDTGRKLVINGLITTDSLLNERISKSYYFKDFLMGLATFPEFDSADVRFYGNNIFLDSLYYLEQNSQYEVYPTSNYWSNKIFPLPGNEYKISVKRAGFPNATATTTIPRLVKIERFDTSRVEVPGSNSIMNCKIEFTDPPGEKNYYLFNIITIRMLPWWRRYMEFDCHDPIIEEELCTNQGSSSSEGGLQIDKNGYAFSDKLIDGKKYSLNVSFKVNQIPNTSYIYYFRLISITEDYFKFIQTLNLL